MYRSGGVGVVGGGTLAATGFSAFALVVVGLALLIIGLALVRTSVTRRAATTDH
ncbi:MAG TPA: hypothetical protein VNT56_10370 [Acidimicrobiales bacterium]|jgi:hypothetical protein|nr:hypothetical protein [Acidimicrobiales bacterium]